MTHYLYRLYDADGGLLYIGQSNDPWQRFRSHRHDSAWWVHRAVRGRISVFPDRAAAKAAEREAIKAERPRYNIHHRWAGHGDWTRQDFVDYQQALTDYPFTSRETNRRISRAREVYEALFDEPMPRPLVRRETA